MNLSVNNNNNNAFSKPLNGPFLPKTVPNTTLLNSKADIPALTENNNQIPVNGNNIHQIWSEQSFLNVQVDNNFNGNNNAMSWAEIVNSENACQPEKVEPPPVTTTGSSDGDNDNDSDLEKEENTSPSHHARRPMNAFLIFCKKHRPIVRENFPTLENRGVTKILGEWWSLLDEVDKKPYTDLAKEYKDKFMSENPGFKWYKLPAPPLRTLQPRPPVVHKSPPPTVPRPTSPTKAEFTPGKLADESQLGSLTSLLNNCLTGQKSSTDKNEHQTESNNNSMSSMSEEFVDNSHTSPVNLIKATQPPKPIKKRPYELHFVDNKSISRSFSDDNVFHEDSVDINGSATMAEVISMTKQEMVDRSVDNMFTKLPETSNGYKEVRKSGRSCKGKRYEQFMVEGKLLGNKRDMKLTQNRIVDKGTKVESQLNNNDKDKRPETQTPKLGLESTIKRLAERTNIKITFDDKKPEDIVENKSNDRLRTISETSEESFTKTTQTSSFNLDLRINNLPCLSYNMFLQRKRENKKRKNKFKPDSESKRKVQKVSQESPLTGAKKRKNKHKITHLNNSSDSTEACLLNDLSGLATLAEVAAKTEKLDEQNISDN